jgi:hypothetical protein
MNEKLYTQKKKYSSLKFQSAARTGYWIGDVLDNMVLVLKLAPASVILMGVQ